MNEQSFWLRSLIGTAVLVAGAGWMIASLVNAYASNGVFGFPLDDPWIHLQFARNLSEHGAFSYYRAEQITSGSTSPLYTMLLAAGFFFTSNEFYLSYALGAVFLLASAWIFMRLLEQDYARDILPAVGGGFLLLLEPRMTWIALSGMETTLFIALLLGTMASYRARNGLLFGFSGGLLIWTRPEAIIFLPIIVADALYHARLGQSGKKGGRGKSPGIAEQLAWIKRPLLIILGFGITYALFNLILSGSVLPNTFAAKLKYYSSGGSTFPSDVFSFLTGGHMVLIAVGGLIGAGETLYALMKSRSAPGLIPLLWIVTLFAAYWISLPHLYQEGRYLIPVLPFVLYIAIRGIWLSLGYLTTLGRFASRGFLTGLALVVLGIIGVHFIMTGIDGRTRYAEYCRYINDRQVRTAHWIREHLPPDAVIGTHDIGALGFYSDRRIVDMVGLVSPDMIENIGSFDRLRSFLAKKGVTHLACLRNWFAVANQNPLFMTDEWQPEIMEVYAFDPKKVHFMPQDVAAMVEGARFALESGQIDQAGNMLSRAIPLDPSTSRTRFLLAKALVRIGKLDIALVEIENALRIQVDNWDAHFLKADILAQQKKPEEAVALLEKLLEQTPAPTEAYRVLARILDASGLDPERGRMYLEEYNRRTGSQN